MTTIGIFGGTFDPIHVGHLQTATELLEQLGLAEVRFVPCRVPPHHKSPMASAEVRLRMLQAAVDGTPGFIIDERELRRAGPSYSVDTLESMRSEFAGRPLGLIVGMDAFTTLASWHRWEDLFGLAHIIVVHRPSAEVPGAGALGALLDERRVRDAADLDRSPAGGILLHAVTQLDISSTDIRGRVHRGASPRYLVTEPVADIIAATGCYRDSGAGDSGAGDSGTGD